MTNKEIRHKKIFVRTFGCQMNVRDSEVICGLLRAKSYELTANPNEADIVIFNTCSVRQHAEDKVWSEIGRISKLNTQYSIRNTRPLIGLVGCMAQNYKEKIFARMPQVDFVVGPADIAKIPDIIEQITSSIRMTHDAILYERKIWQTDGNIRPEEIYHTGFYEDKNHAFVVISEGCSNYCSFCVVPYVRGELKNRHYQDIIKEIEEAVSCGIIKFTLLGQNVNAYKDGDIDFIKLLERVSAIKGIEELSFITSHPKDTSLDLFKAMQGLGRLKKYLHLPVQAGSDRILKLMNRGYTKAFYSQLIDNYRRIVKNGCLSTDIIVGFPSETEDEFQETYDLVKDAHFDSAYIFKYSPRPNTQAAMLCDDVEKKEKERRHKLILDLQRGISLRNKE